MGLHYPSVPGALHGTFVCRLFLGDTRHARAAVHPGGYRGQIATRKAVHAISTGYAGLLGAMIRLQRSIPFVLTEHGIYTKERKIDLAQATWIHDHSDDVCNTLHDEMGYIRGLWIKFYEQIGRMAYAQASPIVSLYEGNRLRQIADGAAPEKTRVITNGINLQRYQAALEKRPDGIPPILGLIGRVVPIKDIKTFIRTMRMLVNERTDAQGWIVGPEDEDPSYVNECKELVSKPRLERSCQIPGLSERGWKFFPNWV